MNFLEAAWSIFFVAVFNAVSTEAASLVVAAVVAAVVTASWTFRMTVRSEVRADRFRNRRLFAWRIALAAFLILGIVSTKKRSLVTQKLQNVSVYQSPVAGSSVG